MRERFIDEAKIFVKGGDGGNGCTSFRREKYIANGGPDGGDGGNGGNVILETDAGENDLLQFKYKAHFKALPGGHGQGSRKNGKNGKDIVLTVPPGTLVYDCETGDPICDLTEHGQQFVVAHGGRGGRGNAKFSTPTRHVPRFSEKGEPGDERWVKLVLKILADAGIVGFPNAGKSSLLSKITSANPKIASYPFTTLTPVLGIMYKNDLEVVLADVPGLVEGAHKGQGLGLLFLKHIERTRMLIHMIDISDEKTQEDPIKTYESIRNELDLYDESMENKPEIIVLNKIDLVKDREILVKTKNIFKEKGLDVLFTSCNTGEGIEELSEKIFQYAEEAPDIPETIIPIRPEKMITDFSVEKENDSFIVKGYKIEKLMAMMDLYNPDVVSYLQKKFKGIGLEDALINAGAKAGDNIIIGGQNFDFDPDL